MKLQTKRGEASYGKFITFIDYEPRGRGFNSCQPHQMRKAKKKKPAMS